MLAWHFLSADKCLNYGDRRLVEVGVPLECEGEPSLCENGMHGSVRLIDALLYASGPIVCRVEIDGDIIEDEDKICGRRRTVLWMLDATRILHEFACSCAEDALALVANPDPRSVAAVKAKRKWLADEITDDELDAAWSAARSVSLVAGDAVRAAAHDAAGTAAQAAPWSARYAAWSAVAAAEAVGDAAWSAAQAAQASAWSARASAWSAAQDDAIAQLGARLEAMVMAAHEKEETKST